ncbi:hypothetical protein OG21DRAFT_510977 [Imleria badia]|nr:hypothetical protein OG21DRAFT_510977 [Imleria badia]
MIPFPSVHQIHWKRPLPPAVSFVLAQPQQSRSLASAADNLPNILRRAMPLDHPSQPSATLTVIENHDQSSTDNSTESPPVHPDHESLGAVSITSLFRHGTQFIYYDQRIKIPSNSLRRSLFQTKFLSFLMPITPHPLFTLQPLRPLFRKTLL